MTKEKYAELNTRLAALERLILQPARTGRGGTQARYPLIRKKRVISRRRLDSL